MDHGGIGAYYHPFNVDCFISCKITNAFFQIISDDLLEFFTFSLIGSIHPANNVCTVAPLFIDRGINICNLSCLQLYQLHGNGGGPYVYSDSVFQIFGNIYPLILRFLYKGIIINHNKNRANLH